MKAKERDERKNLSEAETDSSEKRCRVWYTQASVPMKDDPSSALDPEFVPIFPEPTIKVLLDLIESSLCGMCDELRVAGRGWTATPHEKLSSSYSKSHSALALLSYQSFRLFARLLCRCALAPSHFIIEAKSATKRINFMPWMMEQEVHSIVKTEEERGRKIVQQTSEWRKQQREITKLLSFGWLLLPFDLFGSFRAISSEAMECEQLLRVLRVFCRSAIIIHCRWWLCRGWAWGVCCG